MRSDHLVEEIKSKIDIVDLIAEHVELKRSGQNYKGLCPFHSEKTPSFMVNPSKQIFHCFGCNKGGDIFTFLIDYEKMTFQEAISYLAGKAGLRIENFKEDSKINKGLKESLLAMYKEASGFFTARLKDSERATSYITGRGLSSETIEKFSLGYSRNERDALFSHLKRKGFPLEHIKASGLVYFGESASGGGPHDFFRDRLMFPIFDMQGRIIAFGGRTLSSSKSVPKYINSPDSILFKKGESCYGINIAKSFIPGKGYSIIVEGYLDSIMCHQYGFGNTIAPLGTALTAGHLKKLRRFSDKVLLLFDGDSAGTTAAKRSLELIYAEGMVSKVLMLPQGEDPDTFLRKHGGEHFRKYMGKAISPVEFIVKVYGKNKLDGVRHLLSILQACPDPLQRDETLRELSSWSAIDELTLRQELKNLRAKPASKDNHTYLERISEKKISREEQTLLSIIFSMPEKSSYILNNLDPRGMGDYAMRGLFEKMKTLITGGRSGNPSGKDLMDVCSSEEQKLITRFSVNSDIDEEHVDEIIEGCLRAFTMKELERRIKTAGDAGDIELLHSLLAEKKRMLPKRRP
ncbi:MAG: DNA primase [Nitrospirae bacterium]|nr:DNA primase [Nitrospirota bacterium]MCL5238484.1 DNA primase [Nitrospirota bacterium]